MEYKDVLDTMTGEYNNLTKSGRKAADYILRTVWRHSTCPSRRWRRNAA